MKKMLLMGMVAMFMAPSAFANVRVDQTQSGVGAGIMEVDLQVDSTYVYKLKNDMADSNAALAGQQEAQDSVMDFGEIKSGIFLAGNSNACTDLNGLALVGRWGVSAVADVETGLTPLADAGSCSVLKSGSNVDLLLNVPMASILGKSGAGTVSITYNQVAATAKSFTSFKLCNGPAAAASLITGLPACTAKTNVTGAIHGAAEQMHLLIDARLAGTGAVAKYQDKISIDLAEAP